MGRAVKRTPPPRPPIVWVATFVVSLHCLSVPVWFATQLAGRREVLLASVPTVVAAVLLGCQAIAVFRRHWIGSWIGAVVVGGTFVIPGAWCFFTSPMVLFGGGTPVLTFPKPFVAAGVGLWGAAALASGVVMLWWATRLYRWRVLKRRPSSPRLESELAS